MSRRVFCDFEVWNFPHKKAFFSLLSPPPPKKNKHFAIFWDQNITYCWAHVAHQSALYHFHALRVGRDIRSFLISGGLCFFSPWCQLAVVSGWGCLMASLSGKRLLRLLFRFKWSVLASLRLSKVLSGGRTDAKFAKEKKKIASPLRICDFLFY